MYLPIRTPTAPTSLPAQSGDPVHDANAATAWLRQNPQALPHLDLSKLTHPVVRKTAAQIAMEHGRPFASFREYLAVMRARSNG